MSDEMGPMESVYWRIFQRGDQLHIRKEMRNGKIIFVISEEVPGREPRVIYDSSVDEHRSPREARHALGCILAAALMTGNQLAYVAEEGSSSMGGTLRRETIVRIIDDFARDKGEIFTKDYLPKTERAETPLAQ